MTSIYEQIGRRVVELYTQNAQFAAKPKSAASKKPNCKPSSIACGFTCISGKKICRITMTMEQQQAAKALKKELTANKKEKLDPKHLTGAGKASDPSKEQSLLSIVEKKYLQESVAPNDKPKIKKMVKFGLDEEESIGLAAYIGIAYKDMNSTFWDKNAENKLKAKGGEGYHELTLARVKAAQAGLSKLPPVTLDDLNAAVKKKGPPQAEPYSGTLTHGMKLDEAALKDFVGRHEIAAKTGETVQAGKFMSTGWGEGGEALFTERANVQILVAPKMDGTGQGKMVDQYKNLTFENEVLYGPDAKFTVSKIERIAAVEPGARFVDSVKHTADHDDLKLLADVVTSSGGGAEILYDFAATSPLDKLLKKHKLGLFPQKKASKQELNAYHAKVLAAIELEKKKAKVKKIKEFTVGSPALVRIHYQEV
jgi:hypothetical protein